MSDDKKKDEIKFQNVAVQFVSDPKLKHIQLPQGMTYKEGRYWLTKIETEETRTFTFRYTFKGWSPLDAMWALYQALAKLHGFVHVADFKSMWGDTPPTMVTIEVDHGKTQQIPWGPIEVNGFSGTLVPRIELSDGQPCLAINADIRNNERRRAEQLMEEAEATLLDESIYRGKAIEVDFTVVDPRDFKFDPLKAPKFWDTSKTNPDELILPEMTHRLLTKSVWTPIRKTAECREHQIPLRRGVLLAGPYGVGKTLAARVTAKLASDNKWTFLYLRDLSQLKQALYFAKRYQPCVIFAEDVNRVVSGERDQAMDEILNTMDGVDRKNDEVMVIFTTNEMDKIHRAMMRPGRIDTVITVSPPDAVAAERLVRLYGRSMIPADENLAEVGKLLTGQIPAIIREAVERSKLAAIGDVGPGEELVVRATHLTTAAHEMLGHAELLKDPPQPKPDLQVLGEAFGKVLNEGIAEAYNVTRRDAKQNGVKYVLDEAGRPGSQDDVRS